MLVVVATVVVTVVVATVDVVVVAGAVMLCKSVNVLHLVSQSR